MTNEEARIIVEQLDNYLSHTCQDYGERDHEAMTIAIKALEQESESICKYGILHKIAEFFQNWDGDETAKMEISVNDMREVADVYRRKARAERQLKEKALDYNPDEWCHDCKEYNHDKHCCPRYNKVIRSTVEEMKQPCEDAISREEAIGAVANLFEMSEYPHPYSQGKPIRLRDIKEKLKQLPSVHPKPIECEDAISRQATIDTLWAERKELDSCMQKCLENNQMSLRAFIKAERNRIEEDIYIIKNLPPVTPKPKTGQWVLLDECSNSGYYCSECHKKLVKKGWSDTVKKIKFCPNCGARMEKPQESEDT